MLGRGTQQEQRLQGGGISILSEKQQGDQCGLREGNGGERTGGRCWRGARLPEPGSHWKGWTLECDWESLQGLKYSNDLI